MCSKEGEKKCWEREEDVDSADGDDIIDAVRMNFTIPAATPPGDYLVRFEHIALHSAGVMKGAQFYIACGQITGMFILPLLFLPPNPVFLLSHDRIRAHD